MTFVGRFFLLVLVLGFVELYLLINVASALGFWATLFFCVFTGIVGGSLVRSQGLQTLADIQGQVQQGQVPAAEIVSGVVLLIVGAMLITPGFITDGLGFLLLVPQLRMGAAKRLAKIFEGRFTPMGGSLGGGPMGGFGGPFEGAAPPRPKQNGKVIDIDPD